MKKKAILNAQKEAILSEGIAEHSDALVKAGKMSKASRKENIRLNRQVEKLIDNPLLDWQSNLSNNPVVSDKNTTEMHPTKTEDEEYIPRPSRIVELRQLQEESNES